ncbi:hypothetical protein A3I84_00270 [Candidatus Nomurabacteria bacterium RIFCSPLOWO2_02_FULL_36_8]|nr:MAG: hypothetical protein A3I84_00270 [Candidatus Nomurabacteria bacterium RIFCSPLOWO2_02_FULL_36_8]
MEKNPGPEKPTDMQIVLFISGHIMEPCKDEKGNNIRDFYMREAQRYLDENVITEPIARKTLKDIIDVYSKKTEK